MPDDTSRTTDPDDLLVRLRETGCSLDEKAADEIERLRNANALLKNERSRLITALRTIGQWVATRAEEAANA